MKKITTILVMGILTLFGCNPEKKFKKDHKIIYYNTNEFELFEAKANIKITEAHYIMKKFADNNKMPYKPDLFFVIDDYYAFTILTNPKKPKAFTGGIWVNSKTGITKHVKDGVFLEIPIPMKKIVW